MLVCQKHLAIVKTSEMLASALHGERERHFSKPGACPQLPVPTPRPVPSQGPAPTA